MAAIGPRSAGGEVLFSVRPEDLKLRVPPNGPGRVTEVAFLGAEVEHRVELAGEIVRSRASGLGARVLDVGTRVASTSR